MDFIETLGGVAILVLIGKAVIETFWGLYFIALGLFWHTVAISLSALAVMINAYKSLAPHSKG